MLILSFNESSNIASFKLIIVKYGGGNVNICY